MHFGLVGSSTTLSSESGTISTNTKLTNDVVNVVHRGTVGTGRTTDIATSGADPIDCQIDGNETTSIDNKLVYLQPNQPSTNLKRQYPTAGGKVGESNWSKRQRQIVVIPGILVREIYMATLLP